MVKELHNPANTSMNSWVIEIPHGEHKKIHEPTQPGFTQKQWDSEKFKAFLG